MTSRPTTLVDVRVGYKFSEQAKLWLDVFNLFNNTGAHQIDYFYPSQWANEKDRFTTFISKLPSRRRCGSLSA